MRRSHGREAHVHICTEERAGKAGRVDRAGRAVREGSPSIGETREGRVLLGIGSLTLIAES